MEKSVFIYNNDNNSMEVYYLDESQAMPYASEKTLTVGEFMGSSKSPTIWTSKRLIDCWNRLRNEWGEPIYIGFAFKRIWEGGHGYQSQHYAGAAIDMAQNLNNEKRAELRDLAKTLGCWEYVEPVSLSPTWVHVDSRLLPAACEFGFIELKQGSINTYVLILQDALNTLGFTGGGLDGIMGSGTINALKRYQEARSLEATGITNCETWEFLTKEVRGIGMSETTVE